MLRWGMHRLVVMSLVFIVLFGTGFPSSAADLGNPLFDQGMALYQNRDYLGAESYFGQVLYTSPTHHQARFYLAAAMAMQGKTAPALQHLNYLVQIEPRNEAFVKFRDQVKASQQATTGPATGDRRTYQPQAPSGDAYVPGVRKEISFGGGEMEPLMAHAPPATPVPTMPAGYEALREPLSSADPQLRREAIRSIIDKKDTKTIPLLMWAMHDRPIRELAGRALQNIGDPAVAPIIEFIEKAGSDQEKEFGLITLAFFNSAKARSLVIETWKKAEPNLLGPLEKALSAQGSAITKPMLEALAHENPLIRLSAGAILRRQGDAVIDPLAELVRSVSAAPPARAQAVAVLDTLSRDKVFEKFPEAIAQKLATDQVPEVAAFAKRFLPVDPDNPGVPAPAGTWSPVNPAE